MTAIGPDPLQHGLRTEVVLTREGPEEIRDVVSKVRAALGSISALQWTAFSFGAGDLTTASADEIQEVLAVAVGGLVTAVQSILPDLAANKGALLVTNGGLGFFDPQFDAIGVKWNAMGVSVANSAKHKVVAFNRVTRGCC
jgi:NADP-dependent 3-hydroxy acid dehydrogenase YdfG